MDWMEKATRFSFRHYVDLDGEPVHADTFHIEARPNKTWAVLKDGLILDKESNDLIYEAMPSEQTELLKHKTRFASKEEAYQALQKYHAEWERQGPGWRRRKQKLEQFTVYFFQGGSEDVLGSAQEKTVWAITVEEAVALVQRDVEATSTFKLHSAMIAAPLPLDRKI